MKLLRYKHEDAIRPGILDGRGLIRDVSSLVDDWSGDTIQDKNIKKIQETDINNLPIVDKNISLAPCLGNIGKFICVGLNYSDHITEMGITPPKEPVIFMKATSAISGPNEDIHIPKNSKKLDWEVELGVFIGKHAKYINENEASEHIAGFCVVNDLSEREFQLERSGQWVKGKSCDTFGPIGPYLVTKNEINDIQNLNIWLELNGKRMQESSTSKMVFKINYLISYLSQFMSLHPGDLISTGTPHGVGIGRKPEIFLKNNDELRLGIDGLGEQNQKVKI
tara:strand:- start:250 stop:1089 length:840 start_codon:yes stop_codon:yes gene_type:complete